jgi:hypothetical protein
MNYCADSFYSETQVIFSFSLFKFFVFFGIIYAPFGVICRAALLVCESVEGSV